MNESVICCVETIPQGVGSADIVNKNHMKGVMNHEVSNTVFDLHLSDNCGGNFCAFQ